MVSGSFSFNLLPQCKFLFEYRSFESRKRKEIQTNGIDFALIKIFNFLDKKYCEPNPCKNGGKCITLAGGYKCICDKFKGVNCESK